MEPNGKGQSVMNTLRTVPVGQTVHVVKVHGDGPIRRRIMDMGLTKDTEIYVQKVAPFGDPVEVIVRGYSLSLRKADAERIEVR
jgi:ferrous iron transport protein A